MQYLVQQCLAFVLALFFSGLVYLRAIIYCIDYFNVLPADAVYQSISALQEQNSILFNPILIPIFCHGLATFVAFLIAFVLSGRNRNNLMLFMIGIIQFLAIVVHDFQMEVSLIWLMVDLLISGLLCWSVFLFFLKLNRS